MRKSVIRRFILLMVLVLTAVAACVYASEPYEFKVQIVNKAKLPPKRLADAIYAKSVLTQNKDLLRECARIDPSDPTCYYLQANYDREWMVQWLENFDGKELQEKEKEALRDFKRSQSFLEKALTADPNYLPALYKYAVNKPTVEQRMQSLERIALIDKDNGWAYYQMALVQYGVIFTGRNATKESNMEAFPMSDEEWNSIAELLEKANSRPVFAPPVERIPSVQDVRVTLNEKALPKAALESLLTLSQGDFIRFPFNARNRQIARQAAWHARFLNRQGRKDAATEVLKVAQEFSDTVSRTQPYDIITLLVGRAMKSVANHAEKQILQVPPDRDRLLELERQRLLWAKQRPILKDTMHKYRVQVEGVLFSKDEPFFYIDLGIEEAGVKRVLMNLGILSEDSD